MNVDNLVKGLLNKSLKLEEIPEDKIDIVIDELKKAKKELAKQQPPIAGDINSAPPMAPQMNVGSSQVNKKEKINYFGNGQWDIEEIGKGDDDRTETYPGPDRRNPENTNVQPMKERRGQKKEVQLDFPYKEAKQQAKDDLHNAKTAIRNAKRAKNKEDYQHALDTAKAGLERAKQNMSKPKQKMAKSGYQGYDPKVNIKRKEGNLSDKGEGEIQSMPRIKRWGKKTRGTDLDRQVKEMKRKSKKAPVKVYSKEEIEAYNKKLQQEKKK